MQNPIRFYEGLTPLRRMAVVIGCMTALYCLVRLYIEFQAWPILQVNDATDWAGGLYVVGVIATMFFGLRTDLKRKARRWDTCEQRDSRPEFRARPRKSRVVWRALAFLGVFGIGVAVYLLNFGDDLLYVTEELTAGEPVDISERTRAWSRKSYQYQYFVFPPEGADFSKREMLSRPVPAFHAAIRNDENMLVHEQTIPRRGHWRENSDGDLRFEGNNLSCYADCGDDGSCLDISCRAAEPAQLRWLQAHDVAVTSDTISPYLSGANLVLMVTVATDAHTRFLMPHVAMYLLIFALIPAFLLALASEVIHTRRR